MYSVKPLCAPAVRTAAAAARHEHAPLDEVGAPRSRPTNSAPKAKQRSRHLRVRPEMCYPVPISVDTPPRRSGRTVAACSTSLLLFIQPAVAPLRRGGPAHRTRTHAASCTLRCLRTHLTRSCYTAPSVPHTFYFCPARSGMSHAAAYRGASRSSPSSGLLERGRQALDGDDEGKSGGRRGRVHSQARRTVAAC